ncbi:hypothetical protein B0T14DRAFT_566342 [Immersiella caudata]|uniref:Uncharacterized protein n=1 Tax=Immersiella caudata TaxID=314043 RepID=A0AA39WQ21_9PEZI|nr:hypothetical protein B0T14DRAFT_566342 [Immersiella caudata]
MVKRRPVRREDFNAWINSALFLHLASQNKEGIISAENGDLLTDPDLRGKIFLKSLLLRQSTDKQSTSITNLPLKYGYNFSSGHTNRERQSAAGADQEAKAIIAIWDRVLPEKPEMVSDLSDMLNNDDTRYADVFRAKSKVCLSANKISMGSKPQSLKNIFPVGEEWYEGEDKNGKEAVMGVLPEETIDGDEGLNKRLRLL